LIVKEPVSHILVVKLDHAGDVLWATPSIATLRRNFPAARLSVICTPYTRPVLENNPAIDDLVPYAGGPYPADLPQPDLALCLDTRTPALRLNYSSRARVRAGYYYFPRGLSVLWPQLLLTHPFLHPASRGDFSHEVLVKQRLLEKLGIGSDPVLKTQLFLTEAETAEARARLSKLGHAGEPLIALHLPLKWLDGGWPASHVSQLAAQVLPEVPGARLLVTCGPGEEPLLRELSRHLPAGSICVSGLPFRVWAAAFSLCGLVISRDCGPVHVAAALGVPVVSVFEESKRKEHTRWEPWGVPHVNVFRSDQYSGGAEAAFGVDLLRAVRALLAKGLFQ
jgi:ADP-heptose:LPS heptosyltransferase